MRINHTKLFHGALFFVLAFLTACGGGGGGGSTAPATTYTIGGAVNGLTGTGLVLQNNGGGDLPITASGNFVFATPLASGATYTVTVKAQPSGQICTVNPYTGTVLAANITTVAVTCASPSNVYTIGGTVNGLTGTGLVLQNNGGDNLSISASGNFVFVTPLASGATYTVTVKTQPAGQTCTVNTPTNTGTVTTANIATVAVACTSATNAYTIGGAVNGLTGTGLVLQNNGGGNLSIATNGNFVFATPQASGTPYQVTVQTQPTGQTCTVTPSIGVVSGADVSTVTVTCSTNTYTIGGTVGGLTVTGLVLLNNGVDNLTVGANATAFTFSTAIASGAGYNVTVLTQPTGQTCTVNAPSGTVAVANVGNVSVTCSVSTYSIGGTISNLTGNGLVLQNNGGNNLTVVAASGTYTFATQLAYNSTYNITVLTQPAAQICTVANASGTATAAVNNANVTCVNSYTIGGTITGAAAGVGPILQNNLGDNLFIPTITTSPTNFTFSTPILGGAPYSVTQRTRARAPSQDCSGSSITNGSGTVGVSNVTNVLITCVPSPIVPKFAFVANSTANLAVGVSAFTIDSVNGNLTAATPNPTAASGDVPYAVAVDPTGQFAYVVNSGADSVSVYSIDAASGVLTVIDADGATVSTQASIATGDNPISIAVHPSGKFAYVANHGNGSTTGNTLSAYSINTASGALSAIDANGATGTQAIIATGTYPYAVTVDPLGKFAYVANDGYSVSTPSGLGNVSAYTIDQVTGALTAVVGSPFAAGTNPRSIAIDPTGKFAFAANAGGDISAYSIDAITVPGKLTQINCASNGISTCSGNNYAAGSAPRSIAVDPNTGLYAYVSNAGGGVSAFAINISTGALSAIDADAATGGAQATIAAGSVPISINVDPSGQFVYVANFGSDSISIYSIAGGSGALTLTQTLSTGAGSGPTSVTTTQ